MEKDLGAPDIVPRVNGSVTEYPSIPGPYGPGFGVVPGTGQACPCPSVCPFHSTSAFEGPHTVTAGLHVVDVNAKPPTKIDRLSTLVTTFLDGMLDELADRVSLRVLAALEQREAETNQLEADAALAVCAEEDHVFGNGGPMCDRCGTFADGQSMSRL